MFERSNEGVNLRGRWSKDEDVINVDEKVKRTRGSAVERCISFGAVKSEFKELPSEFVIPLSRACLRPYNDFRSWHTW